QMMAVEPLAFAVIETVAAPGFAPAPMPQTDSGIALDTTYDDYSGQVTFQYPAGWQILLDDDETILVASEGSYDGLSGQFAIVGFKSTEYVPSLTGMTGTPIELLEADAQAGVGEGFDYGDLYEGTLQDGRSVAYTYVSDASVGGDGVLFIVDLGNGEAAMMMVITALGDMVEVEPLAFAVIETVAAPGFAPAPVPPALPQTDTGGNLQTYVNPDGSLSFAHPTGWVAEALDDRVVLIVSAESVYDLPDLDSLGPNDMIAIIYPTIADNPDYPAEFADENTVASTIVSFYASMGFVEGYQQEGTMEIFTLGAMEASSSYAHAAGHDRLVIAVDNGYGDYVTLIAYSGLNAMPNFEQQLLDLLASAVAG
ncbi:MAG: hypothetical protein GYB65_01620, partial [Chloroflexi bacterium]|nr:hypothetical protein [Chloroflexota bacterium]